MDVTQFARNTLWWQPPKVSSLEPRRVIAQVMNLGTFESFPQAGHSAARTTYTTTLSDV